MTKASKPMPVATTTEAGRQVVSPAAQTVINNATAERARKQTEAKRAADALNGRRADTTTPLVGAVPLATIPEPPATAAPKVEKAARRFSLQTTIAYRNREITIACEGLTLDEFCDLLDARKYASPAPLALSAPIATADAWPTLHDGTPMCPKHMVPMRLRERQGDKWWSHKVTNGNGDELYCKGYKAKDSLGYDVE
jgi:hypothetical protein